MVNPALASAVVVASPADANGRIDPVLLGAPSHHVVPVREVRADGGDLVAVVSDRRSIGHEAEVVEPVPERFAFHIRHDVVENVAGFSRIVERNDERMVE